MSVRDNLERVRERISRAAERVGRDPSGITIVGVTKTCGPSVVMEGIEAGLADIGENRVQEFLAKYAEVRLPCHWHLVGHLQTNKVNKALGRFSLIQSVDSLRLAERLSRAGVERGIDTDVLVEVNTGGEDSKYGVRPEETLDMCARISGLGGIRVRGLMTVGPWVDDESVVRAAFAGLRKIAEEVSGAGIGGLTMEYLSMGMTEDFEIAVEEGSTMVRLGRVLFGGRPAG